MSPGLLGSQLMKVDYKNHILFDEPKLNKRQLLKVEVITHPNAL